MAPDQGKREISGEALAPPVNVCHGGPSMKRDGRNVRAIDLLSIGQTAAMLGVSKRYIYVLIAKEKLDWYDIGNRKMIHVRDALTFKTERETA